MIKVKKLYKRFGEQEIIKDANFSIDDGDFVGIVGESGSGKSTLLYLLSGLLSPTSGKVFFDDLDITSLNDKDMSLFRNENINFVFQMNNLVNGLTVEDNLKLSLAIKKNSQNVSLYEVLKIFNLEKSLYKEVSTLSGGEKQRIAIARAILNNGKYVFADEPTGSLDSKNAEIVLNLFKEINSKFNKTIIMVTHSEKQLIYCNKVIEINDGEVISVKNEITNDKKLQG